MHLKYLAAAIGLQISQASAGSAVISNCCAYDIWLWIVETGQSSGAILVPARSQYSDTFRSTGTSVKVSTTNTLIGSPHTQFEYSVVNNTIWYDISFVDCAKGKNASSCPGHAEGVAMDSPNAACGRIKCSGGSYCPTQVYYVDTPLQKLGLLEPVFTCPGAGTNFNLYMKMCSDREPMKNSLAGHASAGTEVYTSNGRSFAMGETR